MRTYKLDGETVVEKIGLASRIPIYMHFEYYNYE